MELKMQDQESFGIHARSETTHEKSQVKYIVLY